ncbi:MAG: 5-bromo-4-chloroindolyl phosphate hydrolysis family protein [Eubacterium sp.]|jgi:5-bromo-4-chloroindolyl phosphate hydrolysis protein
MNDFDDLINSCGNILNTVTRAVENGHYEGLSENIKEQMSGFTSAGSNAGTPHQGGPNNYSTNPWKVDVGGKYSVSPRPYGGNGMTYTQRIQSQITPFTTNRPSTAAPIVKKVIGILGIGTVALFGSASILTGSVTGLTGLFVFGLILLFGGGAGFGALTADGFKSSKLNKRYYQYSKVIGNAEYITIKDLSERSGVPESEVIKDLKKMQAKGLLPRARFDSTYTTLMLTPSVYHQYVETLAASREAKEQKDRKENEINSLGVSEEVKKVLRDGDEFLESIKQANDLIQDPVVSEKLDRMAEIVEKIFKKVKEDPASAGQLRKFMNYYLPTTKKLVFAYADLENQPSIEGNISQTKSEINSAIDTINNGFENLLDSLFEDESLDLMSDISVMKTMMAQDGLSNNVPHSGFSNDTADTARSDTSGEKK